MTDINKTDRFPSLDGWRCVAILLVLLQHSDGQPGWPRQLHWWPIESVGGMGVRFFFVISGFLITWLMLKEYSKYGAVSLRAFYVRRVLRIIPVYLTFLLTMGLIEHWGSLSIPKTDWVRSLTFTVNFGGAGEPLGHLWSLGVEEQFYLLWPSLAVLVGIGLSRRLVSVLLVPLFLCPVFRFVGSHFMADHPLGRSLFFLHAFPMVADGLAIGCLGAILWHRGQDRLRNYIVQHRLLVMFTGCALIVLPLTFWAFRPLNMLKPFHDTLQCSGFLLLLLLSIALPRWWVFRPLNWRGIVYIGLISYSLYIWLPLFEMSPAELPFPTGPLHGFPGWLVGVFGIAMISYHLLEMPILRQKSRVVQALTNKPSRRTANLHTVS